MPLSPLQETPRDVPCKTRGQDGFAISFPVGLLHPLQHAGLTRRTPGRPSVGRNLRELSAEDLSQPDFSRVWMPTSAVWAFPVKLIRDEGKRCAAYRWLFARRFPKRALSRRRRAVRERVIHRLAPIATLALPSHKGSFPILL